MCRKGDRMAVAGADAGACDEGRQGTFLAHTDDWVDVRKKIDEYKEVYSVPTDEELEALAIKDTVKISNGFERFFVRVTEVDGDTVHGVVDNHLVGRYDYDFSDVVRFEKRNIFSISRHTPKPPVPASAAQKSARRLIRMLGIDPAERTKEAMAIMTILEKS